MNLPDVTLLFQMFHFLIAYSILRRYVFAPTLTIIESEQRRKDYLQKRVDVASTDYATLLQQQRQRWRFIKLSLGDMVPSIRSKKYEHSTQLSSPVQVQSTNLSEEEKRHVKQLLHDELLDIKR